MITRGRLHSLPRDSTDKILGAMFGDQIIALGASGVTSDIESEMIDRFETSCFLAPVSRLDCMSFTSPAASVIESSVPVARSENASSVNRRDPANVSYRLNVGHGRLDVNADLFNAFNSDAILVQNNTFGAAWQRPLTVIQPRFVKFHLRWDF